MHECKPPGRGEATLCIASTEQGDREDGAVSGLPLGSCATVQKLLVTAKDGIAHFGLTVEVA